MSGTKLNQIKTVLLLGAAATLLSLFQNCSKTSFSASKDSMNSTDNVNVNGESHQPGSCNSELMQATVPIKILFVVDMSGSNHSSPGTDVDKSLRGGSIQQFFNDYQAKANFSWGFVGFQGTKAMAFINDGSVGTAEFSSQSGDMQAAIAQFYGTTDDDYTPYKAALKMATQAISDDAVTASASTKYVVVFLSDGMPTDYPDSASGDAQIDADVQTLVGLVPGRISFNTIYYGPHDTDASNRLQGMASAGGGQFLDTNSYATGRSFYISDTINIPGVPCN